MISIFAKSVLSWTWESPLLWLSAFGFLFPYFRRKGFEALVWMAFSVMVSFGLKQALAYFTHGQIVGCPSIQTNIAICFFGYLALCFHKKKAILIGSSVGLVAVPTSLFLLGYHTLFDIFGSVCSGGLILFLMQLVTKTCQYRKGYLCALTGGLLGIDLLLFFLIPQAFETTFLYTSIGILVGAFFSHCILLFFPSLIREEKLKMAHFMESQGTWVCALEMVALVTFSEWLCRIFCSCVGNEIICYCFFLLLFVFYLFQVG